MILHVDASPITNVVLFVGDSLLGVLGWPVVRFDSDMDHEWISGSVDHCLNLALLEQ